MPVEILMPELGEGVHEGTVSRWLKKVGDAIKEDEPIVEIMTDKVNTELPAPASGVLLKILIEEGQPVGVFQAMGLIGAEDEAVSDSASPTTPTPTVSEAKPEAKPEMTVSPAIVESLTAPTGKRWYSPVVRAMAKQHGVSESQLASIHGTGSAGRVTKKDLSAFLENGNGKGSPTMPKLDSKPVSPTTAGEDQTMAPLAGMRKVIAEHMIKSSAVPAVSTVIEVDVTEMVGFRERNKESFASTYGVKLTYTPFFIKALTEALMEFPMLNASLREDGMLVSNHAVHMGIAVSLGEKGDEGLIVPVIRNCEQKSLVEVAKDLESIAKRARSNSLGLPDIQGGTFTLTNPGSYGALFGTPMINAPQAAIGGAYGIQKVTKVVNDMIAIRSVMYFVLTYDHRIIDGLLAGKFLQSFKKKIEGFDFLK